MGKYVGGYHTLQPKQNTFGKVVENISNDMKVQSAQKIINDPNATPMQQAMALASLNQEKLGVEVFKKAANQSTLAGIEERLSQNLGIAQPTQVEAPRDRSWRDQAMSGMTPPIRDASQDTVAQPGAEGTGSPTQPGFSVSGPQNVARNSTALNQQAPNPNMAGGLPQVAPQATATPQVDPEREAAAYEKAAQEAARAGNHPVATQYANKAKEVRKEVRANKEARAKEDASVRAANAPWREKILNSAESFNKDMQILDRIEKLSPEVEVTPAMAKTLQVLGIPISVMQSKNAQEMDKLSQDLTTQAVGDYGSRLFATEFQTMLRRIPTLLNDPEGRQAIIRNLKMYKELGNIRSQTYMDLYNAEKANGVRDPIVRREDVLQIAGPKEEEFLNLFNESLARDFGPQSELNEKVELAPNEVSMVFPDGTRRRVNKSEVGKWLEWGRLE